MDGLGTAGYGLLFQQALYQAMARKMVWGRDILRDEIAVADSSAAKFILPGDSENTTCAFLDLQGIEEIGTAIFCNNFSVAISLIAGLRSLTYKELFDSEPGGWIRATRPKRWVGQASTLRVPCRPAP